MVKLHHSPKISLLLLKGAAIRHLPIVGGNNSCVLLVRRNQLSVLMPERTCIPHLVERLLLAIIHVGLELGWDIARRLVVYTVECQSIAPRERR